MANRVLGGDTRALREPENDSLFRVDAGLTGSRYRVLVASTADVSQGSSVLGCREADVDDGRPRASRPPSILDPISDHVLGLCGEFEAEYLKDGRGPVGVRRQQGDAVEAPNRVFFGNRSVAPGFELGLCRDEFELGAVGRLSEQYWPRKQCWLRDR